MSNTDKMSAIVTHEDKELWLKLCIERLTNAVMNGDARGVIVVIEMPETMAVISSLRPPSAVMLLVDAGHYLMKNNDKIAGVVDAAYTKERMN